MTIGNMRQEKRLFGARIWADSCIAQLGEQQLQEIPPFPLTNLNTTRTEKKSCAE